VQSLEPIAEQVAALLVARRETVAVAESSTGGLISSALLSVPGASAYFLGGAVVYTKTSRQSLLGLGEAQMSGLRPSTEAYAHLLAETVRDRHDATWGIGETGATGPTGNRYGDAAGHCCIGIGNSLKTMTMTIETGRADRPSNMRQFASTALSLFLNELRAVPKA
jgi:PncC family amidohydrolase